jgi:hypothetical protein
VDTIFVIPEDAQSLPQLYQAGYDTKDESSYLSWCGVVGEDSFTEFHAYFSPLMPVYSLPRTGDCSSSLLRLLYHSPVSSSSSSSSLQQRNDEDDDQNQKHLRWQVAFAPTRKQDGKPIDKKGNLLL